MRVKFMREFAHPTADDQTTVFPVGYEDDVKAEIAKAAVEAGAAKEAPVPPSKPDPKPQ